jgi:hypothetical protein
MNLLDLQSEKVKTVNVQGHEFKIRFMTPLDRVKITQHRMRLQGGNPVESLTQDDFIFFENIAIVDTCVEELPKDFKAHESCIKWDDTGALLNDVAHEIRTHTTDIEQKLKKNKSVE